MHKDYLLLRRAALSRPSGEWDDDDFDVLANSEVVRRAIHQLLRYESTAPK
jgi:hypothetical protein